MVYGRHRPIPIILYDAHFTQYKTMHEISFNLSKQCQCLTNLTVHDGSIPFNHTITGPFCMPRSIYPFNVDALILGLFSTSSEMNTFIKRDIHGTYGPGLLSGFFLHDTNKFVVPLHDSNANCAHTHTWADH